MSFSKLAGVAVLIVGFLAGTGNAGWLDDTIKSVGGNLGYRAVDEGANSAYDGAKEGAKGAVKSKPADAAKKAPAASDEPVAEESAPRKKSSRQAAADDEPEAEAEAAPKAKKASSDASAPATLNATNEKVFSKYDFVPGDKMIFFDDFSDTDVGEFPRKWHLKGPKPYQNNAVEVAEFQGKRYLRSTPAAEGEAQNPSVQYVRLDIKNDLPPKFTVEFDAFFGEVRGGGYATQYELVLFTPDIDSYGSTWGVEEGRIFFSGEGGHSMNTKVGLNVNDGKLHRVSISVNGTFVKAYVDSQRVVNDPDGVKRPIRHIGIGMGTGGNNASENVMIGNVRIAQGGKDVKSALDTDGRIVTHGILFDTGKETIKPESLPTLKSILTLLNDDDSLRFAIEGHTDNQGGKGLNQPLSERRAASVKAWLVGKGIEDARLTTKGLGDSKPLEDNKTAEGRANNRRVEFVKF